MSDYIRRNWKDGELIDAEKLNNIEQGIAEAKKAAESNLVNVQTHNTDTEAHQDLRKNMTDLAAQNATLQNAINGKAPAYSYGTTDLTAGSSELETGKLHFVYE